VSAGKIIAALWALIAGVGWAASPFPELHPVPRPVAPAPTCTAIVAPDAAQTVEVARHHVAAAHDWRDEVIYFVLLDRFANGNPGNDAGRVASASAAEPAGPAAQGRRGALARLMLPPLPPVAGPGVPAGPQVPAATAPTATKATPAPTDPYAWHGGDLAGLIDKLDDLADLGVTTIWLSPIYQNRPMPFYKYSPYHGYWVWDFFDIDPHFGSDAELQQLVTAMKARGMRLLLDTVVNHAGYDAPLARHRPSWFHQTGEIKNWNDPKELTNNKVFGLPDFAHENGAVRYFHAGVARHWLERTHPAGLRLDAVKHVPLDFWNWYNNRVRTMAPPGFFLLGELLTGDPRELARTLEAGAFDSLFDFPLYYTLLDVVARGGSCRQLGLRFFSDRLYRRPDLLVTLLDNHDVERFLHSCGGNEDKLRLALALITTCRGIPSIYYGTEVGLTGAGEPDNRRDMPWHNLAKADLRVYLQRLLMLRHQLVSLRRGVQLPLVVTDPVFAFARLTADEIAVAVLNNGSATASLTVPLPVSLPTGTRLTNLAPATATNTPALGGNRPVTAVVGSTGLQLKLPARSFALFSYHAHRPGAFAGAEQRWRVWWRDPARLGRVPVTFAVTGKASPGTEVFIIGELDEIGAWNTDRVTTRVPADANGELGSITVMLPAGAIFEFKTVARTGGKIAWAEGANGFAHLPMTATAPLVLPCHWPGR